MPEAKKEEPTVDIATSGPDVDIKLPEEKAPEEVVEVQETGDKEKVEETKVEETKVEEKQEPKEEKQEELEEYSEGVKKRIAKLTKKWREAERQKEAALDYARVVHAEHSDLKTKFSKL